MNKNITELFCLIDDFCNSVDKNFAEKLLPSGKKPTRTPEITHSEIFTIIWLYHQSKCDNFKIFYVHYLKLLYETAFPKLPSYSRFIRLKSRVLWYLALLMQWFCEQSKVTGISYIIYRCLPSKKDLEKQSFQRVGKDWKDYLWVVFRYI